MTSIATEPAVMSARLRIPRLPSWARVAVSLAALGLVTWLVLVPQFSEAARTLFALERVSIPLLVLAVLCELGSLMSYTALTATVFGRRRPPFTTLLRLDLIDLGINHVVPGGAPVAAGVRVRLFRTVDVRGTTAMSVTTVEIVVANLMLGVLLGVGVVSSLGSVTGLWFVVAGIIVLVLLLATVVVVWGLVFHTEGTVARVLQLIARIRFLSPEVVGHFLRTMARQLRELLLQRSKRAPALVFSALNWVLDVAVLWIMLCAFGTPPLLGGVIAIYAVGSLVTMLPITPGGLGIVEGFMVPALVTLGTLHSTALLAVLAWRLLEYWLPLPLAAAAWVTLWVERVRVAR